MERLTLRLWFISALLLLLAAAVIVGVQCLFWLKEGVWHSYSTRDLLHSMEIVPTPVSWRGVQIILDWVFWLTASVVLLAIGSFTTWIAFRKEDAMWRREIERERRAEQRQRLGSSSP